MVSHQTSPIIMLTGNCCAEEITFFEYSSPSQPVILGYSFNFIIHTLTGFLGKSCSILSHAIHSSRQDLFPGLLVQFRWRRRFPAFHWYLHAIMISERCSVKPGRLLYLLTGPMIVQLTYCMAQLPLRVGCILSLVLRTKLSTGFTILSSPLILPLHGPSDHTGYLGICFSLSNMCQKQELKQTFQQIAQPTSYTYWVHELWANSPQINSDSNLGRVCSQFSPFCVHRFVSFWAFLWIPTAPVSSAGERGRGTICHCPHPQVSHTWARARQMLLCTSAVYKVDVDRCRKKGPSYHVGQWVWLSIRYLPLRSQCLIYWSISFF